MGKREPRKNLTAEELIARLQELPPEIVIKDTEYDDRAVGYDTMETGVHGVSDTGYLQQGDFIRAFSRYEEGEQNEYSN